jgi:two-component system sensor histidine kinase BaeS
MTRRITWTVVAVVAGALIVASLGTFAISVWAARRDARSELGRQATRLASTVESLDAPRVLQGVAAALKLEGSAVLRFGPAGRTVDSPPAGVSIGDLDVPRLQSGHTVTGNNGSLVYAAAPATRQRALVVVVLTRRVNGTRPAVGLWLLVAGGFTLLVAAVVSANLGRRLVRPLREAQSATGRIASGDLAARVPEHRSDGEELAGLARSINTMAAELERSQGLERQFLLSVSHDLRTPLTSIRGYAEALADGRAGEPAKAAEVILAESRRLERLVQDLLELARLGSSRFSLNLGQTEVSTVVTGTVEGFSPAAADAAVSLDTTALADGVTATADPDRLAQVVANLVENALKFAAHRIWVGVSGGPGGALIWVDDDGPGVGGDPARVFEPFVTSGRAPSREVGTGLGLAIVRELVVAMGGTVRAEPAPGGGARLTVTLPP